MWPGPSGSVHEAAGDGARGGAVPHGRGVGGGGAGAGRALPAPRAAPRRAPAHAARHPRLHQAEQVGGAGGGALTGTRTIRHGIVRPQVSVRGGAHRAGGDTGAEHVRARRRVQPTRSGGAGAHSLGESFHLRCVYRSHRPAGKGVLTDNYETFMNILDFIYYR